MVSYLVLVGVAILFLGVCRFFFYTSQPRRRAPYVPHYSPRRRMTEAGTAAPAMETRSIPVVSPVVASEPAQPITEDNPEATKVISREELTAQAVSIRKGDTAIVAVPVPEEDAAPTDGAEQEVAELLADADSLLRRQVRHFLTRYATVTPDLAADVTRVTERALEKLDMLTEDELADSLSHIMVQEALVNMQRVYVMMPDDAVLEMVTDAFTQVALGERNETLTLLAYDALQAMTHMEHGHFRVLALLLLFHYSRNTNTVSTSSFRRYADKYVRPLVTELPTEFSVFQQLEYLRCATLRGENAPFGEVMRDSYPYFFAYQGFTKDELEQALGTTSLRAEWIVRSVYEGYYKLAVVDSSGWPRFFVRAGITDKSVQERLRALMQSRPAEYDPTAFEETVRALSPAFGTLLEAWNGSMMRRSVPTLLGMYIGQLYVKTVIGEEFDLSRWL